MDELLEEDEDVDKDLKRVKDELVGNCTEEGN